MGKYNSDTAIFICFIMLSFNFIWIQLTVGYTFRVPTQDDQDPSMKLNEEPWESQSQEEEEESEKVC